MFVAEEAGNGLRGGELCMRAGIAFLLDGRLYTLNVPEELIFELE